VLAGGCRVDDPAITGRSPYRSGNVTLGDARGLGGPRCGNHRGTGGPGAGQTPASATAPMHENTISFIQAKRKSEPIPMEWMTAIGHMA